MEKRNIEIAVISDVHLGTFGCRAKELLDYLNSINPKTLILNGDILDIWQFRKRFFPKAHLAVIKRFIELSMQGTKVVYITGNHDELLRKFSDINLGNFLVVDQYTIDIDGKKAWFFHGDIFDASIKNAKWLAKLGGFGYELLIRINRGMNWTLKLFNYRPFSLSRQIKQSVKNAMQHLSDFEKSASDIAIGKNYKFVICGHIHHPRMVRKVNDYGTCLYLNSGDWIEHLSVLEYNKKRWSLNFYHQMNLQGEEKAEADYDIGQDVNEQMARSQ